MSGSTIGLLDGSDGSATHEPLRRAQYALLHFAQPFLAKHLEAERLVEWALENRAVGQRVLGELLPATPSLAAQLAMEGFGSTSAFARSLAASFASGAFWGDAAAHYESKATKAKGWAADNSLKPEFRKWASWVAEGHAESARREREDEAARNRLREIDQP